MDRAPRHRCRSVRRTLHVYRLEAFRCLSTRTYSLGHSPHVAPIAVLWQHGLFTDENRQRQRSDINNTGWSRSAYRTHGFKSRGRRRGLRRRRRNCRCQGDTRAKEGATAAHILASTTWREHLARSRQSAGTSHSCISTCFYAPTTQAHISKLISDNEALLEQQAPILQVRHIRFLPSATAVSTLQRRRNYARQHPVSALNLHQRLQNAANSGDDNKPNMKQRLLGRSRSNIDPSTLAKVRLL